MNIIKKIAQRDNMEEKVNKEFAMCECTVAK